MRIKVFSPVDEHAGKPPVLELDDASVKYRVRVWHRDAWFELAVDSQNRLTLRQVDGRQLIVEPRASNEVRIDAEKWR